MSDVAAPWVLLRGLTRDSRHWGSFAELMQQRFADARIVTLDMPGNGLRHRETSPASVEDMAQWCRAQLREQGLAPPYRVLAMSLGAMVALAWMQQAPQELQRGVLINTSLRPYSAFYQRLRPRNYVALLYMAVRWQDAGFCEQTILRLTSAHPAETRSVLADWVVWRRTMPVSRRNAWRQLWAAMRFLAPSRAPDVPLLLLAGAHDGLVNPQCSRQLARAWGSTLIEHPQAGHDLPLDDDSWILDQL